MDIQDSPMKTGTVKFYNDQKGFGSYTRLLLDALACAVWPKARRCLSTPLKTVAPARLPFRPSRLTEKLNLRLAG